MITKTYQARKMRQEIELVEERPQGECVLARSTLTVYQRS